MKTQKQEFIEDVETLLEKAIVEEATQAVWQAFDKALENLDEDSRAILMKHFEGVSQKEISAGQPISEGELRSWLGKVKSQVAEDLRRKVSIKQ